MRNLHLLKTRFLLALVIPTAFSGCLKARLDWEQTKTAAIAPSRSTPGYGQSAGGGVSKNSSADIALFGTAGRIDAGPVPPAAPVSSNVSANLKLTSGTAAVVEDTL